MDKCAGREYYAVSEAVFTHPSGNNFEQDIMTVSERSVRFKGKILPGVVWQQCVDRLQDELPSQQFNTWIRPLQATTNGQMLTLFAPNRFIKDFVSDKFADRITELVRELEPGGALDVVLEIGGVDSPARQKPATPVCQCPAAR